MTTAKPDERLDGVFSLIELPGLIVTPCRKRLSGVLWCERDDGSRRIVYSNGWPIAAASSAADEQIEAHLLDTEQLDAVKLQKASAHSTRKKIDLQQALSDLSLLSKTTFVEQLLALRKKIVISILARHCRARFETSTTDPAGFSFLPLLECCAAAVSQWSAPDQQAAMQVFGAQALTLHAPDAELAMALGAPKQMLEVMQGLTRQAKTATQLLTSAGQARAYAVAAVAARIVHPPDEMAPFDGNLDRELADAIRLVQDRARGDWDPVLPAAVQRTGPTKTGMALALGGAALFGAFVTRIVWRPQPPAAPSAIAPEPQPASLWAAEPSVLDAAAHKVVESPRVALNPDEQARFEMLLKRGDELLKKKKIDAAIRDYKAALELDPVSPAAHRALAAAYGKGRDQAQSIFEYKVYLRLAPGADDREAIQEIIDRYLAKRAATKD